MSNPLLSLLNIKLPIIPSPMVGVSTPRLAAAVSNAGGLGSIGIGASSVEQARAMLRETAALTDKPFNVNLFCHVPAVHDTLRELQKPRGFLEQLNQAIPTQASVRANPKPSEIVCLRPDIIEEREKPFFNAWIYWKEDSGRRPSKENQHKTLLLLGPEAAQHSRERNASSRWSATDTGGVWKT